ncbi:MAG: hypothetical protein HYV09_09435 [Deltaproteobacteria bacterium]|nr:hypothetical protein [Deltaproteobacteria bacterium]
MGAIEQRAAARASQSSQTITLSDRVRARALAGVREATRELHGAAAVDHVLSQLSDEQRASIAFEREWVPVELLEAWVAALWDGPLGQDPVAFRRCVDRGLDHGFGRVKKTLLAIATPHGIVRRASELWRGDFTDGRLVAFSTSPTSATLTLHEHCSLSSPLMRELTAESFRYVVQLAGARNAVERHEGAIGAPLVVHVSWSG